MSAAQPREFVELLAIVRGQQRSRALTVVAELGIADLLRDGPRHVDDLAAATSTHAPTLYRVLRALAAIGIFVEEAEQRFALSPMTEYLRRDHPLSVDPAARMFGANYQWLAWGALRHSVETGENAAVHALGMDVWEHRRRHPEQGEVPVALQGGTIALDTNSAVTAAQEYLAAAGVQGSVAVSAPQRVEVTVRISRPTVLLGLLGRPEIVSTGTAEAQLVPVIPDGGGG